MAYILPLGFEGIGIKWWSRNVSLYLLTGISFSGIFHEIPESLEARLFELGSAIGQGMCACEERMTLPSTI